MGEGVKPNGASSLLIAFGQNPPKSHDLIALALIFIKKHDIFWRELLLTVAFCYIEGQRHKNWGFFGIGIMANASIEARGYKWVD